MRVRFCYDRPDLHQALVFDTEDSWRMTCRVWTTSYGVHVQYVNGKTLMVPFNNLYWYETTPDEKGDEDGQAAS